MSIFTWGEIKLPSAFYTPGTSFSEAWSISPNGQNIVGTVGDRPGANPLLGGKFYGFLRPANGISGIEVFAFYDYPDNIGGATSATGVNDAGDVVGFYRIGTSNEIHGYLWRHAKEKPINLDAPTAIFTPIDLTAIHNAALGIARTHISVGVYREQVGNVIKDYGYLGAPTFYTKVDLGPFWSKTVLATRVSGVNANLDIVGSFDDNASSTHGYKWGIDHDDYSLMGRKVTNEPDLTDIYIDGSVVSNTSVMGINDQRWIVGYYTTADKNQHGFVWKPTPDGEYPPGKHVTIDILGSTLTAVNGIANDGTFVGYYRDGAGRHAFVGQLLP